MTDRQPTLEQTARAAELGNALSCISKTGWRASAPGYIHCEEHGVVGLLDPRAFQQVLLALPRHVVTAVMRSACTGGRCSAEIIEPDLQWLLAPAGMLAFYEALVAQEGGDA